MTFPSSIFVRVVSLPRSHFSKPRVDTLYLFVTVEYLLVAGSAPTLSRAWAVGSLTTELASLPGRAWESPVRAVARGDSESHDGIGRRVQLVSFCWLVAFSFKQNVSVSPASCPPPFCLSV